MQNRFAPFVSEVLIASGWFSGRREEFLVNQWKIDLMKFDSLKMFPAAEEVLLEFGEIKCKGKNYQGVSFEINPTLGMGEGDRFDRFSNVLKTNLYPLGEAHGGHVFLVISEDGRIFQIMENLFFAGKNFDEALNNMIIRIEPEFII